METLETFSWNGALIFMQYGYLMVFSYVSEKNEIKQADNLNFRFCLLESAAGVILEIDIY